MTRCTTRCTSSRLTYQLKYKRCYRLKKIVPWETQLQFSKVRPLLGFSTPFFHFIIFYISSFLDCGHCLGLHHLASTSSFSIFPSSQIHNFLPHVCLIVLTLNGMAKFFTIWTSFVSDPSERAQRDAGADLRIWSGRLVVRKMSEVSHEHWCRKKFKVNIMMMLGKMQALCKTALKRSFGSPRLFTKFSNDFIHDVRRRCFG